MEKKKVQANTEDVIKALSSYLEKLNFEDGLLRTGNKRLTLPIDRLKSIGLWDSKKMVLEYVNIQKKQSKQPAAIRHWIEALVLHIIKQVEEKAKKKDYEKPKATVRAKAKKTAKATVKQS